MLASNLQENFAKAIAIDGLNQTDAYKAAGYSFENMLPATVTEEACRLAADHNVSARIQQLREASQAQIQESRSWDLNRYVQRAEQNLDGAQQDREWSAANAALVNIGKATGLLEQAPQAQAPITTVVVVLNHGDTPALTEATTVIEGEVTNTEDLEDLP